MFTLTREETASMRNLLAGIIAAESVNQKWESHPMFELYAKMTAALLATKGIAANVESISRKAK